MCPSLRTPEGRPTRCPICGHEVRLDPTNPPGDAPCPRCGHLLWFDSAGKSPSISFEQEFLRGAAAIRQLSSDSKADALRQLVLAVADAGRLPAQSVDELVAALEKREQLGSTGVGHGCAIPHVAHELVSDHVWAVGFAPQGIEFESLDNQPVTRIVLLLSPLNDERGKLKLVERASRALRDMTI
jgi:PTS system fructose-specific IIA component/PTS system nitrogen regulatory IIA component